MGIFHQVSISTKPLHAVSGDELGARPCPGTFSWLVSRGQGWLVPGMAGLVAQGNTRQADFRGRSVGGAESRGARLVQ